MKDQLPSLITPDSQAGLTLACKLAAELHAQLDQAHSKMERPGGMNYLLPPTVPREITSSILFYAIAAANRGGQALSATLNFTRQPAELRLFLG